MELDKENTVLFMDTRGVVETGLVSLLSDLSFATKGGSIS